MSCKEIYNDYEVKLDQNYYVINGAIYETPGPYMISVRKVLPYTNNVNSLMDTLDNVKDAEVRIKSDKGENVLLTEISPGVYKTRKHDIKGEIGHKYSLYVKTNDGDEYESAFVEIKKAPEIASIDAKIEKRPVLQTDRYGEQYVEEKEGLNFSILSNSSLTSGNVKIDTRIIVETIHSEGESTVFCWFQLKDEVPNVKVLNSVSTSDLKELPAMFLIPVPNLPATKTRSIKITYGYIVEVKTYFIDSVQYKYYSEVKEQLQAKNKIFDPVPTQIKGNMRCISKPEKEVYGNFNAASVSVKQSFFSWVPGLVNVYKKDMLKTVVIPEADCKRNLAPKFWQKKN